MSNNLHEFYWRMGREGVPLSDARKLLDLCRRYQDVVIESLSVNVDTKRADLEHEGDVLVAGFGCKLLYCDDARGAILRIVVPSGYTNDFRKTGVLVPHPCRK